MEGKGESAVRAVVVALALGFLGAALFRGVGFGVNFSVWVLALVVALLFSARGLSRLTMVGLVVVGLSSVGLGWYSSPDLTVANVIALIGGFGLATLGVRSFQVAAASVWDLTGRLVGEAFQSLGDGLSVLGKVPWKGLAQSRVAQKNSAVLRGALIATPIVMLFGALFSRADAVFSRTVTQAFSFDASVIAEWSVLSVVFATVALGVVGAFSVPAVRKPPMIGPPKAALKIGMTEVSVVLCSLIGLFGLFVLIQFQYLFGGAVPEGLSYANYARQGFFELLWVSGLMLPLLVGAHAVAPLESKASLTAFRVFSTVLTGLLFVVMASAMVRMQMYVETYGLTSLRVSSSAFMGWLVLVFCWFLASLYRGTMQRFAIGAMVAGFGVIAALNFATPDAISARYNVARFAATPDLDATHLANLGAETVPIVRANWSRFSPQQRAEIEAIYRDRYVKDRDWRGDSVSEMIAARL